MTFISIKSEYLKRYSWSNKKIKRSITFISSHSIEVEPTIVTTINNLETFICNNKKINEIKDDQNFNRNQNCL